MDDSYLERLKSYTQKLIDIRNDLAHAIEDAEFLSVDPVVAGVEESHIDDASKAVVLLGSQIQKLEQSIQHIEDQPPTDPMQPGLYDTNPFYYSNPSQDSKDKKNIKGILKDLTPCDKKDWGLRRRFRYNPSHPTFHGRRIRSHRRLRRYRPRFLKNPYRRRRYHW